MRKLKYVKLFEEMNSNQLSYKDFKNMEPNEVVNKLIPYLDMKNEVKFNIQLDPKDPENPGKSILRIWDNQQSSESLRIPIEKEKYEEILSLLKQNYGSDNGRYKGKINQSSLPLEPDFYTKKIGQ
jgi:hypothetical protein